MKRIIITLLMLIPILAYGQSRVYFGGTRGTDTAYTPNNLRAEGRVLFPYYKQTSDSVLLGVDVLGRLYTIKIASISGGVGGGGSTNLGLGDSTTTTRTITSSSGSDVTLPSANDNYAGLMSSTMKKKLDSLTVGGGGAFYDSVVMQTTYRTDTAKKNLRTDISSRAPSSRKMTINGVQYDLSADRVWNVTSADSTVFATLYRVDTAKTAIRGDISSRVPNSRTITINGVSYDLSANRSWTVSVPDSSLFATIYRNDTSNANIRNEYFKKSDTSNLLATKHIVTQLRFSGVTTKVLTLTFADGDTLQASFVDATSGGGSGIKNINGDTNSVQALVDDDGIVIVSDLSGNHVFYVDSSYVQTKYGVDTMRSNVYSAINGINGLKDGDKGDITVSGGGATWTILDEAVTEDKIAPDAITTNKILDNAVSNDKFRQSAGLSVVGRSANTTGDVADITAGSDYQVLRRSGSTIGFGQVDLGETNAVTGALKVANGGSGVTSITGVVIGNGASNYSAVTGTANQLLRRNAGNTAYEFFTPSYITGNQTITLSGDVTGSGTTSIFTTIGDEAVTENKIDNGAVTANKIGMGAVTITKIGNNAVTTSNIINSNVTLAKIENLAQDEIIGRYSSGSGAPQKITLGSGLTLNHTTGELTASGGGGSTDLALGDSSATYRDITSSTGADVRLPAVNGGYAGLMTATQKLKLDSLTVGGGGSPSLTKNHIGYGDGSNLLKGNSRFTYNDTNLVAIQPTTTGYMPILSMIDYAGSYSGNVRVSNSTATNLYNTNDFVFEGGGGATILSGAGDVSLNTYSGKIRFNRSQTNIIEINGSGIQFPTLANYSSNRILYVNSSGYLSALTKEPTYLATYSDIHDSLASLNLGGGVYLPTVDTISNIQSWTSDSAIYVRNGKFVQVSGFVAVTPRNSTASIVTVALPIASNINGTTRGRGHGSTNTGLGCIMYPDATNDVMRLYIEGVGGVPYEIYYSFTYIIQ